MLESPPLKLSDFRPGMRFLQYELLEQIGVGGQGVVWSAFEKEKNRIVAIKLIDTSTREVQAVSDNVFEQQGRLFRQLTHPNVLPHFDFGSLQNLRYQVTLYVPGGSLDDQLVTGPLPVGSALYVAAHIASALEYLHGHEIIHRDLKPGNVLVDFNHNIYVFDFGLARVLSGTTMAMHTGHGTFSYSPPEQFTHSAITIQSDLYSFGVMLYQFFTGRIPWDGEIALGVQQLNSSEEIPDPREYNADLPPALAGTLRRITAAKSSDRPGSATEVMQMLYDVFNAKPFQVEIAQTNDISPQGLGVGEIIKRGLANWENSSTSIPLTLTKFALVDVAQKLSGVAGEAGNMHSFMLHCALVYGYDSDFWWKKIEAPTERLRISSGLIRRDNLVLTTRVLGYLLRDQVILHSKIPLSDSLVQTLLEIAGSKAGPDLKQTIFGFLERMVQPISAWQTSTPGPETVRMLAQLASEESSTGDRAARLIGCLHSAEALAVLVTQVRDERRSPALLKVLEGAGNLPASIPRGVRLSIYSDRIANWLGSNISSLLGVYGLAALGVFLGFGSQVYLTYRLPNYMDLTRISISVERGLSMGFVFGFGIFITRLLSEILPSSKAVARMAIATLVGGAILTTGLLLYDLLFLNTFPGGILYAAGCFFISAGYAFAQWVRPAALKISISAMVIFLALIGTWIGHIGTAATPTGMSPIFFYDYAWPIAQVFGTMLAASLPMAVFGTLGKIPPR